MTAAKKRRPISPIRQAPRPQRKRFGLGGVWLWITLGIIVVVLVVAFFPIALATDEPTFCRTCHNMGPFYTAWSEGPHAGKATCIDCHVDAGYPARFVHKFTALHEVYAQWFTKANFPNYNADVPSSRCLRCHPDAPTKVVGTFRHDVHVSKVVPCAKCHAQTGHKVSFESLAAAGVLDTLAVAPGQLFVGENPGTATTSKGSVYPGHKVVPCQNCHDQANLQCSYCHIAPANHYGPQCALCHSNAALPFSQFSHPPSGEHDWRKRACVKCHPNGYDNVYCTCHKGNPPKKE